MRPMPRGAAVAGLVLGSVCVVLAGSTAPPAAAAAGDAVTFGQAKERCVIDAQPLAGLSGLAERGGALLAVADRPSAVYRLDGACRPTAELTWPRGTKLVDIEDLAATPDGTVWASDTGGNRVRRDTVQLYRWTEDPAAPTVASLRYPDGPHDAEALLVDLRGDPIVVTKAPDGASQVFAPPQRLEEGATITMVERGALDVRSWPLADPRSPGSLQITGGAVAPSGVNAILRTYTAAYEWDVPDGDVSAALVSRPPDRAVKLPTTKQGEAITYTADGRGLVVGSEQLPSPVYELTITRTPAVPAAPAASSLTVPAVVWTGVPVLTLLGLAGAVALGRRRGWV